MGLEHAENLYPISSLIGLGGAFQKGLVFLLNLAWNSRFRLPVLITVGFMVLDVRMQLEINVDIEVRHVHAQEDDDDDDEDEDDEDYDEEEEEEEEVAVARLPVDIVDERDSVSGEARDNHIDNGNNDGNENDGHEEEKESKKDK